MRVNTTSKCAVCAGRTWGRAAVLHAIRSWQPCCRGGGEQGCIAARDSQGVRQRADVSIMERRLVILPTSERRGGAEITDSSQNMRASALLPGVHVLCLQGRGTLNNMSQAT